MNWRLTENLSLIFQGLVSICFPSLLRTNENRDKHSFQIFTLLFLCKNNSLTKKLWFNTGVIKKRLYRAAIIFLVPFDQWKKILFEFITSTNIRGTIDYNTIWSSFLFCFIFIKPKSFVSNYLITYFQFSIKNPETNIFSVRDTWWQNIKSYIW